MKGLNHPWHLDVLCTFSHASSSSLQMGYDGFFIGRIDREDMTGRMSDKTLEMLWRGSRSLGEESEIFTGVIYTNHYSPPPGFCYDQSCKDIPIVVMICIPHLLLPFLPPLPSPSPLFPSPPLPLPLPPPPLPSSPLPFPSLSLPSPSPPSPSLLPFPLLPSPLPLLSPSLLNVCSVC